MQWYWNAHNKRGSDTEIWIINGVKIFSLFNKKYQTYLKKGKGYGICVTKKNKLIFKRLPVVSNYWTKYPCFVQCCRIDNLIVIRRIPFFFQLKTRFIPLFSILHLFRNKNAALRFQFFIPEKLKKTFLLVLFQHCFLLVCTFRHGINPVFVDTRGHWVHLGLSLGLLQLSSFLL